MTNKNSFIKELLPVLLSTTHLISIKLSANAIGFLRKGGLLLILNERPVGLLGYFLRVVTFSISAVIYLISKNYPEYSAIISKSGILDNPYLCDNTYLYSQWQQSIKKIGFSFKTIVTPYHTYKRRRKQKEKLIHFICRKL